MPTAAYTFSDIDGRVQELIQESGIAGANAATRITLAVRQSSVRAALREYSGQFPSRLRVYISGNDSQFYKLTGSGAVVSKWEPDFSTLDDLRYPWDNAAANSARDTDDNLLSPSEYSTGLAGVALGSAEENAEIYLIFASYRPAAAEKIAFWYTALHALNGLDSATATTAPERHREPLACLAASQCALSLAAAAGHTAQGVISLEVVDGRSKSDVWRSLAKDLRARYETQIQADKPRYAASPLWAYSECRP